MAEKEADIGGNGSMLFDDACDQPVGRALALAQVAAHRPRLGSGPSIAPAGLKGGRDNGVFDGEDQACARRQRRSHLGQQAVEVVEVVKNERAIDEPIGLWLQLDRLEVFAE